MWGVTLARDVLFLLSAEYPVVMCVACLSRNLSDLTVASSRYDILLCSETLVSDIRHAHVSELVAGSRIWSSCLVVPGGIEQSCGLRSYVAKCE